MGGGNYGTLQGGGDKRYYPRVSGVPAPCVCYCNSYKPRPFLTGVYRDNRKRAGDKESRSSSWSR